MPEGRTAFEVKGRRVTVIGARRSGIAAALLLRERDAEVFVSDRSPVDTESLEPLTSVGIAVEAAGHTERAFDADLFVISPGVPSDADVIVRAMRQSIPVVSELELAFWFCPARIVAVTGSNGKTTTTTLLGHVLRSAGRRTHVAGNIGVAFSAIVDDAQSDDLVVLEVSSFQLDHIRLFRPSVSVLLNITPDHLDRYGGRFEEYAESKYRILENQGRGDVAVYNADDPTVRSGIEAAVARNGLKTAPVSLEHPVEGGGFVRDNEIIISFTGEEERLMPVNEVSLRGRHNLYNSLAAAVAARVVEIQSDIVRGSLQTFQGVPHRLELVGEVDGVRFVNDSKATNVNSLWYALESFSEHVILIAGGRDKGNEYEPVKELVRQKVRGVVALGESADKVVSELGPYAAETVTASSMEEAVELARFLARPGDVVLLSPACASFDMFDDFVDRGDTFRRIVQELQT